MRGIAEVSPRSTARIAGLFALLEALVLMVFRFNAHAFHIYLVFFGFWWVLIGYLIFKSTFMPRINGVLEAVAGLCWLTFLWLPFAQYVSPYNQLLAGLGEFSLIVWLLVMGVERRTMAREGSRSGGMIREPPTREHRSAPLRVCECR